MQRHTATVHLEVEGLTAQVRKTTNFHVAFFAFPREGEGFASVCGPSPPLKPLPEGRGAVKLAPLHPRSGGERGAVKLAPLRRRSRGERETRRGFRDEDQQRWAPAN